MTTVEFKNLLNAISHSLKQRNLPINELNTQKIAIETINDLIKNNQIDQAHLFLEIFKNTQINKENELQIIDNILYFIKNTENVIATKIAIEIYAKIFDEMVNYELYCHFIKLYSNKNIREKLRKMLIKNFSENNFKGALQRKDIKLSMMDFVLDNIPKLYEVYDIRKFVDDFYEERSIKDYEIKYIKLIYKIVKFISDRQNEQKLNNFYSKVMEIITKSKQADSGDILKTIKIIVQKDKIYRFKTGQPLLKINFYKTLEKEINGSFTNILSEIIINSKFILLEELLNFVNKIIKIYENDKNEKCFILLKAVLKSIGVDNFYDLIKKRDVEMKNYIEILKKGRNIDLQFLIDFYSDNLENKRYFFILFSSILQFCTDRNKIFGYIKKIFLKEMENKDSKTIKNIALGLVSIIDSHIKYRKGNVVLENSITKEESNYILHEIEKSNVIFIFLNLYINFPIKEIKSFIKAYFLNFKSVNLDKYLMLFENIKTYEDTKTFELNDNDFKDINSFFDLLRYSACFIPFMEPDFELASKILSLCLSKDPREQKKAYKFLSDMIKYKKMGFCICKTIISNDFVQVFTCTKKQRILTLFECFISCDLCNDKSDFFKKMILELILCLRDNSTKGRKTCYELLERLVNEKTYKEILITIFAGLESDNFKIINGSITCLIFFLQNRKDFVEKNIEMILSQARNLKNKGKECHKSVIDLYKNIILETSCDKKEFVSLISSFSMCRSKKTLDYLKTMAIELKKNEIELTPELKRIFKIKFKRSESIKMTTNRKGQIEITEKQREESNED